MSKQLLVKTFLVSPSEIVRMLYAWCMKFFLTVGNILGWTLTLSVALTHFSIKVLPFVLMINAIFSIVGMLIFSVLINYIDSRKLIIGSGVLSIVSIVCASFFYESKILLLVFVLIASGMFLTQISILLANYLEDYFTPREAERLFPRVDSAETIGGIIAGLMLVVLGFAFMSYKLLWLWAIFIAAFLFIFITIKPGIPAMLSEAEEKSESFRKKIRFNGLVQGLNEIKKTPFLQLLLYVSVLNWIIAQFVEFEFAKAVNDSIASHGISMLEHEIALTYGLGALQILLHSCALIVELVAASRLLQFVGTLGGYLIHAILTFISGAAVLLSFGYVSAVLLRNNFEMSSIIHRTSYETSYYAFKFGTQKPIREIFEGLFMPLGVIIGTGVLIGIELFFLEEHFVYPINILLMFLVIGMVFVSFQLRDKYALLAKKNLHSNIPVEQLHAIEVLGQMKHEHAVESLKEAYLNATDPKLKMSLLEAIAAKGEEDIIDFLLILIAEDSGYIKKEALRLVEKKISRSGIRNLDSDLKIGISKVMLGLLHSRDSYLRFLAAQILLFVDRNMLMEQSRIAAYKDVVSFLVAEANNDFLGQHKVIQKMIKSNRIEQLAEIARVYRGRELKNYFVSLVDEKKEELCLHAGYGLLNMRKYGFVGSLINLLLYGNHVIFKKALRKLENVDERGKTIVRISLAARVGEKVSQGSPEGRRVNKRLKDIYSLTEN